MCRAMWVTQGVSLKDSFSVNAVDTLYALTDGNVRAILRMPRSLNLQKENIKGFVTWKNDTPEDSELDISEEDEAWATGIPTVAEFDRAWSGQSRSVTSKDVLDAIRKKGITNEQAIKAINAVRIPRKKS